MWVKKVSGPDSPAIYYKPQGESSEDIALEKDDFFISTDEFSTELFCQRSLRINPSNNITYMSKKNKDFESSSPLLNVKEPHDLIIDEKNADDEIEWHVKNLKSKSKENSYLLKKKQELLTALDDFLQMSPNKQQQTIKIVQEATIKLQALNSNNSNLEVKSKNINNLPIKKLNPSSVLKAQKRKLALTKPSAVEKMKLTNKLLMKSAHISEKQ
ncbi:hypothetical protein TNCV_3151151 [Trichonephila clavipes]|nr:hypothetical protein TNCV_3151151 [Trichonephila clavipes]